LEQFAGGRLEQLDALGINWQGYDSSVRRQRRAGSPRSATGERELRPREVFHVCRLLVRLGRPEVAQLLAGLEIPHVEDAVAAGRDGDLAVRAEAQETGRYSLPPAQGTEPRGRA